MVKKLEIICFFLLFSTITLGQELTSQKTSNHIQIEGTNIFVIPPNSFEASSNFKGFQNPVDETAMIMIMEIPGPFSEVIKGFTSENLSEKGMELKTISEINVADYNGRLIELDQAANGLIFSKYVLIYGDEKSSMLINGIFLQDSINIGKRIKKSILSTFVDTEILSNPRDALDYSLDENAGSLEFKAVMGNGMLFNRDLKTPEQNSDKATLITDKSFAQVQIENEKLFCISRIKKYPDDYSVKTSKGINEIEIDGLKGYELFATNNDNNAEEMYQVILFDKNGSYYLFVGTYLVGSENAISDIKDIIRTFRRKK